MLPFVDRLIRLLIVPMLLVPLVAQAGDGTKSTPPAATGKPKAGKDGMLTVAGGPFRMGCNEQVDGECLDDEKPGRTVQVKTFRIDVTEVPVAQYARCVKAGACTADGLTGPFVRGKDDPELAEFCNWGKEGREQHPINCVDWAQAAAFCKWSGKRLPTEAEWEKAARGTDGRIYPWGNVHPRGVKLANVADETARKRFPDWKQTNGYDDGFLGTAPVGSFPEGVGPNGAQDMIGNVWEWTADVRETGRVVRGASWTFAPVWARISLRSWNDAKTRAADGGFRCAR